MKIRVGEAESFKTPQDWSFIPDDRQERIETINGMAVQDYGIVEEGETMTCTAIFSNSNFEILKNYWITRTRVTVTDESGKEYENIRVVVKKYSYVERFPKYLRVDLEFWRV